MIDGRIPLRYPCPQQNLALEGHASVWRIMGIMPASSGPNAHNAGSQPRSRATRVMRPTAKQIKFVELVISGANYADAYRGAYDVRTKNNNTIQTAGSDLARKPHVALLIQRKRAELSAASTWTHHKVVSKMAAVAELAIQEGRFTPALRAYELIGKHIGMFSPLVKVEHSATTEHTLDGQSIDALTRLIDRVDNARSMLALEPGDDSDTIDAEYSEAE